MPIFKPLRMDVIGERLHVRKLFVGMNLALRIALTHPGIVHADDVEAVRGQAALHHPVGGLPDLGIVDGARPDVPGIPAHGRRQRQRAIARDNAQFAGILAVRRTHFKVHHRGPGRLQHPGEDPGLRIEFQSAGKMGSGEMQRARARRGNPIEKRPPG